jgi:hypothetical protein
MKAALIGLLAFGVLGACAEQDNVVSTMCSVHCLATAGNGDAGGASTAAGSGGTDTSSAGASVAGAPTIAGGDQGGASNVGGSSGAGTAGSTAGAAAGGAAAGGAPAGGAPAGGAPAGGAPAGGAPAGGAPAGGAPAGGAPAGGAPAGGAPAGGAAGTPGCTTPIPARTAWTASSNTMMSQADLPPNAIDGNLASRYATGTKMLGGEWLQIDMGVAKGTVSEVTILTSNMDFGRHIQIRMSNTSADTGAALLTEADGVTGTQAFDFKQTTARYMLISQTGTVATGQTWWSVYEVNAFCK